MIPMRLSATIVTPETAPPLKAMVKAPLKLWMAAEADRTFERTATDIPTIPETAEDKAPKAKARAVCQPHRAWPIIE